MAPLLPKPSASGHQDILIVLLGQTYLADDVLRPMKKKINDLFQSDLKAFSPKIVPVTDVEEGIYKVDGTLTDIYAVATEAARLGWSSMVILDALSARQLLKTTRWGEARQLMGIVVYLHLPEGDWRPHKSSVFIRRLPVAEACHEAEVLTSKKWTDMAFRQPADSRRLSLPEMMTRGMYLSDPDKSPFIDDDLQDETKRLVDKALNSSGPALPSEIKMLIKKDMREESPLTDLTDAPGDSSFEKGCLRIQSLVHLNPGQLKLAEDNAKNAARLAGWTGGVEVYSWKQHLPCSRRDLVRLYYRHLYANSDRGIYSLLISCSSPNESGQAEVQFGWLREHQHQQLLLVCGSIDDLVKRWKGGNDAAAYNYRREFFNKDEVLSESATVERLFDPANAFPPDTPSWKMPDHIDDNKGISAPPVFYLTKNLSSDEHKAVHDALQELDESDADYNVEEGENGGKQYSFVPWDKEEDGTVEDMFRLLWHMRKHRGGVDQPHECIFVDKQTAQDSTVILADARFVGHSTYSGIEYGRMAAKTANIAWINLDIANMGIEDFVDGGPGDWNELLFFKDPDYNGPLTYEEREAAEADVAEAEGADAGEAGSGEAESEGAESEADSPPETAPQEEGSV